jgi:hypothetical protein
MPMNSRMFLSISAVMFLAMLVAYPWLVSSRAMPENDLPYSYRQVLLESSAAVEGKVIVESGSSGAMGIDPGLLSDYFKAPTIIMAVNVSYPLLPKLKNISNFANPGDVLILPLEWTFYMQKDTYSDDFVRLYFSPYMDSTVDYFHGLAALGKFEQIYTKIPLKYVRDRMADLTLSEYLERRTGVQTYGLYMTRYRARQYQASLNSDDHSAFASEMNAGPMAISETLYINGKLRRCDDYLFALPSRERLELSDAFRKNLKYLETMKNRGVQVYFTWPTVVDNEESGCYTKRFLQPGVSLDGYASYIKTNVEAAGFTFLGEYEDSHFPASCFLDTYYHVTQACAVQRTQKLVEALKEHKAPRVHSSHTPSEFLQRVAEKISPWLQK